MEGLLSTGPTPSSLPIDSYFQVKNLLLNTDVIGLLPTYLLHLFDFFLPKKIKGVK